MCTPTDVKCEDAAGSSGVPREQQCEGAVGGTGGAGEQNKLERDGADDEFR